MIYNLLAKLMLAERFMSAFFDQVATKVVASANGRCEELRSLETVVDLKEDLPEGIPNKRPAAKSGRRTLQDEKDNSQIEAWRSTKWITDWAKISPPLADEDLRPYLFITKDRKDYFGATTALGHITTIAEILLGPRLAVQAKEDELRKLTATEAAQVFEIVRTRIISGSSFMEKPDGIDGITVLAKVHPTLQDKILDLLEGLPEDQLGAWAVSGWREVFKESKSVDRFERLLQQWANAPKNSILKVTAMSVLKTTKGGQ